MSGIYIHIPFCKSKCYYCNFYSIISLKYKDEFINALLHETEMQKDYFNDEEGISTIYIGGGTPSMLDSSDINRIIEKIFSTSKINENPEITIEINPDDIDLNKVKDIKLTSVNRVSLGVQSFFDDDLKYLKRRHNAEQSLNSLKLLQDAGYNNISIDFIYGIPTLTTERLQENLNKALSLNVPHISAYALTIEPGTVLNRLIRQGKVKSPHEDRIVEHFNMAMEILKKNAYQHYEISNFCKEGFASRHNSNYWLRKKYLGIGPSAHSYDINSRQWNTSDINYYINNLQNNNIPAEKEILTEEHKFNEYIMLGLRTMWGCETNYIKSNFGSNLYNKLMSKCDIFIEDKMIKIEDEIIYLTDKGKLFADKISSELFI